MKIAYADPPYIGCAHLYPEKTEVDHIELIRRLESDYDGWILHAAATSKSMAELAWIVSQTNARWMSWVKGFAAFKKNVSVAYAWEPVIIKFARKPVVNKRLVNRDWIQESITLRKGLNGAKPEKVCHWAFEMVGARPEDELIDLYPGTGAVTKAWRSWQGLFSLPPSEFGGSLHDFYCDLPKIMGPCNCRLSSKSISESRPLVAVAAGGPEGGRGLGSQASDAGVKDA